MSRSNLFQVNAKIVADLTVAIAKSCPNAFICIITSPINSIVPIVGEILNHFGVYDPKKIFGITTLSAIRATTFIANAKVGYPYRCHAL